MLHEMGKMQTNEGTLPIKPRNMQEGLDGLNEQGMVEPLEIPVLHEAKEFIETGKVLKPNSEVIKTQSLEAVKEVNAEKAREAAKEAKEAESRPLTEAEAQELREKTNLSETAIESIRVNEDGTYTLKCRNEELAGKQHEVTNVEYIKKTVAINDIKIVVVVPEFPAVFECVVAEELWTEGDMEIFKNCTEQLRDHLIKHPEYQSQFNEQQLQMIMKNELNIRGYTWHHTEVPGRMQLVETKIHVQSGHTGGNVIWCGGVR